jgi:NAD(P)-dependent dehydrogenase (short-subunit alcohol dehydrogenase family)
VTSLDGRVVLLTGASKGIGAETAAALGAAGAHVVAHYNSDRDGAERATAAIPEERRLLVSANLADPAAARGLWTRALAWQGRVDVLVNNAAVLVESPLDDDDADWDEIWATTYATNVAGPMALTRDAVRHFVDRGAGVLITLSSWAAQRGSTA